MKTFTYYFFTVVFVIGLFPGHGHAQPKNHFAINIQHETEPGMQVEDGGTRNPYPPIWDQPGGGGPSMGIICKVESNPRVNNIPLEMGDFIGGFYTDDNGQLRCGGASAWPQTVGVVVSLRGDNPNTPEKDGFTYHEQIYFKVFSWERMKDYDVDIITFDPNSPTTDKWISLGLSEVINIQALEVFDFYISATDNPLCLGGITALSANEFIGSNGNYTYTWSSDPPGFSSNIPNPPPVSPVSSTNYLLTVTDGTYTSEHEYLINVNEEPMVIVGDDALICQNELFTASASAQNYASIQWTTSGDGYFVNDHAFTTNYYPGSEDKASGVVYLTFTATPIEPCAQSASDFITLNIQQIPENSAGPDFQVCKVDLEGVPVEVSGENFDVIIWTTGGDGTFEDAGAPSTLYYPGTLDYYFGDVDLEVCIQSLTPCFLEACDELNISFIGGPSCAAPTVLTRCENIPIPVVGSVSNSSGPLWTTQGDGTFDNPNQTFTNYNGGVNDRLTGGTTVTLNALPISPCTVAATKDVSLIFKPLPRLGTFGANTDFLCPGNAFLQLNATLNFYNSFSWGTNGDGTFSGSNTLSPKYYPGSADIQNGFFELKLTASAQSPCTLAQTFTLNTIIPENPLASISTTSGSAYCGDAPLQASVSSAESFNWATSGDGYFNDPQSLNTSYTPGPTDLSSPAAVTLTLTALPYCSGMSNSQSAVQLYFQDEVSVFAGDDDDFCATGSYSLTQATALYADAVFWSSSGDGTFSNPSILHPNYYPGANDLSVGNVQLTLTGYSIAPCTLVEADEVEISLTESPEVNAGTNGTICETMNYQIQNAAAEFYTSISWETSGDGTFSNPGTINPVYFPGASDISTGMAELTLHANGIDPCNFIVSDQQTLNIQKGPLANAGSNASICESGNFQLQNASAQNYASILWETSGDGSFSNSGILKPLYYPGSGDKNSGSVVLTMTVNGVNPCNFSDVDDLTLSIQKSPVADAGNNATICESSTHLLQNVIAQNYASILWETSGDGTFSNSTTKNPFYFPGQNDILSGVAELTIHAQAINPCSVAAVDSKILNIQKGPTANAGSNATICETGNFQLQNASAQNYASILWETSGDGSFSNSGIINPLYYPGSGDKNSGSVVLTMTANGLNPCNFSDTDDLTLSIQKSPVVNAGPDKVLCTSILIVGSALHSSSVHWTSSGDGTFSNQNSLITVYNPGPLDRANLSANLQLMANPLTPCTASVSDEVNLTINLPTIISNLAPEQEINTGQTLTLSFEVANPDLGEFIWYKDQNILVGQDNWQLILGNIAPEDAGTYQCQFTNSCGQVLSNEAFVQVLQPTIQVFQLTPGWQGISSFIQPNQSSVPSLFQSVVTRMVIISDNEGFYWPEQAVNTLGPWTNLSGYRVKMSGNATLVMIGAIHYPREAMVINSGWSYLPVNSACAVDVASLLTDYPMIEIIKDMAGTTMYWPDFGINTLQTLEPGHAYQVFNNSGNPVSVSFPDCE